MNLLFGFAGWAIIVVVASDIFRSLLVPRASTRVLRLGPVVSAALFPVWHALAGRIAAREARQTMRASLAPLMLVVFLMIWAAMLVLGFGLVFWGSRANIAPRFANLSDAVYAAGTAFSTMGAPRAVAGYYTRAAVLGCSLSGLAIVTVVATFLISIQGGFGRREALVLRLESHVALPPSGIAILETFARERVTARIGPFFDTWEAWSAEVALSHRAFPILMFFRSNDARCEWLAALGAVLDAAALMDATVINSDANARAGAHFLLRTGTRLLTGLVDQFPASSIECQFGLTDVECFKKYRARLVDAGFELIPDENAALIQFHKYQARFVPALSALSRRLRINLELAPES